MRNKKMKQTRDVMSKGIEKLISESVKHSTGTGMEAEKTCPKCGARWWNQLYAVARDTNRGGQVSKFNLSKFEYFVCIGCGHIELPDSVAQLSKDMRVYYSDFVKTINGLGKHKAMSVYGEAPTKEDKTTKKEAPALKK
jgi:hypothetical protein